MKTKTSCATICCTIVCTNVIEIQWREIVGISLTIPLTGNQDNSWLFVSMLTIAVTFSRMFLHLKI